MKVHHQSPPMQFDTLRFHPGMIRSYRENQQLNDELRIKADELEKLFAAHKLRVHGPAKLQADHTAGKRPAVDTMGDIMEDRSYVYEGDRFKGRYYGRYMQKRDAKLREEWISKRLHKEANLKTMQDSLEQAQAEMEMQFAVINRSYARRRAESATDSLQSAVESNAETTQEEARMEVRLQELSQISQYGRDKHNDAAILSDSSSSIRSNKLMSKRHIPPVLPIKAFNSDRQKMAAFLQGEGADQQESNEQVQFCRNKSYITGAAYANGAYKSTNSRLLSSRSVSSSITQTSVAPTPRRTTDTATSSSSIRRRTQSEKVLERATLGNVNSGFRKENTKPSSGTSKVTPNASLGNVPRVKRANSAMKDPKEEKPRRQEPQRKSYGDLSPLNSNIGNRTPIGLSKDPTEHTATKRIHGSSASQPFLKKGNGIGPGEGAGSAKRKASLSSEIVKNGDEFEEEDFERTPASDKALYFPDGSESDDTLSGHGSRRFGDHQTVYNDVRSSLESHVESPGSVSPYVRHSFSYVQEASNVATSMDSPRGSSASGNSRTVKKMQEADAIQNRKTWGNAHNPFSVSSASRQSPKDVSKGFKRLLSFGKKSKGANTAVTDIATASAYFEAGYDTEDGNGITSRSIEDPRMSSRAKQIPDYGAFSMVDILPGQVPSSPSSILSDAKFRSRGYRGSDTPKSQRSLFSLPSFHCKRSGSQLK